ncbi:hypothetical protein BDV96DRAFT_594781 [Lophiotrema nucula]|uniref:Uncharacterized protein n=1 Tax=Lophiotrema nucula TaxID=690887 RepID=A0A6A5ZTL8_9PLEO|nr:hypothetical protein BDV96DRAFT_594781 [Lophiotrema nucula]
MRLERATGSPIMPKHSGYPLPAHHSTGQASASSEDTDSDRHDAMVPESLDAGASSNDTSRGSSFIRSRPLDTVWSLGTFMTETNRSQMLAMIEEIGGNSNHWSARDDSELYQHCRDIQLARQQNFKDTLEMAQAANTIKPNGMPAMETKEKDSEPTPESQQKFELDATKNLEANTQDEYFVGFDLPTFTPINNVNREAWFPGKGTIRSVQRLEQQLTQIEESVEAKLLDMTCKLNGDTHMDSSDCDCFPLVTDEYGSVIITEKTQRVVGLLVHHRNRFRS